MLSITTEQFESLLSWLSNDREFAGRKYETIRAGLVRIFVSKGFNDAEDLADETIDRVATRLQDIRENYEGEPTRYFHGVARNIIRETSRRKEVTIEVSAVWVDPRPTTDEQEFLEQCLQLLDKEKRDLIIEYLLYEGQQKIEHHKQMAAELGITEGALRGRVHQIRIRVGDCVRQRAAGIRVTKLHPKTIVNRSAIGGGGEPSIKSDTIN
jgi:DNA-directed RNA polymerase specialized sigma24 family protein